ncbi:AMP-binding protein [Altererythrobacter sp.]|uniref:AMP-binding protein n=1 Tax=Altererythrobacter sp. TaxID=1872480 RepID=UPI001B290F06|nr:AMP-binding protein [Altererythrobacter sp.]MBO6610017.1 AMP-binding protein [Altererythrobacter sp.]MBO6642153.1 AMP-binding protein [Altererythrobacter sp.]MBO6709339.1 AMP-binding protein [Altererythrobacter sp.]
MVWQGDNFGIALKALANAIEPERTALIHGSRIVTWSELDSLTDRIAAGLLAKGLNPGDVAGQMQRNTPEYILAYFGCIKAGVTPVNVNYHYKDRELSDIFARFGLKALFVESNFADTASTTVPEGSLTIDVSGADWAALQSTEPPGDFAPHDDRQALFFTATGGTTGMPKAVMWPFEAAWQAFGISVWQRGMGEPPFVASSLEEQAAEAAKIGPDHPASTSPLLLLSPLMHGAGQFSAVIHLLKGGTLAMLPSEKFEADLTIDEVKRLGARNLFMVGDAFALPLADALDAREDAAEAIKTLRMITSSGAVFSESNKMRLIKHNPQLMVFDALGSSESSGTAIVITTAAGSSGGGKFQALPGRETKLFDADLNEIKPGEDGIGIVARSGPLPLGYLGEDEKNAKTFPEIDGQRYLMTGDQARWGADGTMEFIGRDNMCINTGGEKVFPEEVEAVLQEHAGVKDVRVVSLPDPRFGRKVVAVVQPEGEAEGLEQALDTAAREGLAGYKIPRKYFFTEQSLRLNNGKPDYKAAQALAEAHGT